MEILRNAEQKNTIFGPLNLKRKFSQREKINVEQNTNLVGKL